MLKAALTVAVASVSLALCAPAAGRANSVGTEIIVYLKPEALVSAPNASKRQRAKDAEVVKVMQDFLWLEIERAYHCTVVYQERELQEELARESGRQAVGERQEGEDPRLAKLRALVTPGPLTGKLESIVNPDYLGLVRLNYLSGDRYVISVRMMNWRKKSLVAMRTAELPMDDEKAVTGLLWQLARDVVTDLSLGKSCADYVVRFSSSASNKDQCTGDRASAFGEFKAEIELRATDESRTVFSGGARFMPFGVWNYSDRGEYQCRIAPRLSFIRARLYEGNRLRIFIPMNTDEWWCFKEGGEGGGPRGESFWWMTFSLLHATDVVAEADGEQWFDLSPGEKRPNGTLYGTWQREEEGPCSSMRTDTSLVLIPARR